MRYVPEIADYDNIKQIECDFYICFQTRFSKNDTLLHRHMVLVLHSYTQIHMYPWEIANWSNRWKTFFHWNRLHNSRFVLVFMNSFHLSSSKKVLSFIQATLYINKQTKRNFYKMSYLERKYMTSLQRTY